MAEPDLARIRQALRDAPDVKPAHIFAGMPHVFRAERAPDVTATYRFDIEGDPGESWTVRIGDGRCETIPEQPERHDVLIACDAQTFLDLVFQAIRPGEAIVDGRLRVGGDLAMAMRFSKIMGG